LTTIGDCWDGFLARNGFVSTIPVEGPDSGEPLMKKQFDLPNNEPDTNPLDEVIPSQSPHEKQAISFELSEPPVPKLDSGHNATMKPYVKKSCKQSTQKHMDLGFQNKRLVALFLRKLRN
jgi:hypothetical protein